MQNSLITLNRDFAEYMSKVHGKIEVANESRQIYGRDINIKYNAFSEYVRDVEACTLNQSLSQESNLLCKSHLHDAYHQIQSTSRNYIDIIKGVSYDECNLLEKSGVLTYAKNYQIVYELGDYIAELIAFMAGDSVDRVKRNLVRNLAKQHIPYRVFSRAILCQEEYLLQTAPLSIFCDVSPLLDIYICRIQNSYKDMRLSLNGETISLANVVDSPDKAMEFIFISQLISIEDFILRNIIQEYSTWKKSGSTFLTSKGIDNFVIQTDDPNFQENICIHLHNKVEFILKPTVCSRGEYYKTLIRACE